MYIAIEGVIGVGKTTLARLLQPAFEARRCCWKCSRKTPSSPISMPTAPRYAFQTQIFFLLSRYHQQRRAVPELLAQRRTPCSPTTPSPRTPCSPAST